MIEVGTIARAKKKSAICNVGEIGVCYEVYELSGRPGYSFIFENGGYDGFSPDDVEQFLEVTNEVISSIADYEFKNVTSLVRDYEQGRFDPAFS